MTYAIDLFPQIDIAAASVNTIRTNRLTNPISGYVYSDADLTGWLSVALPDETVLSGPTAMTFVAAAGADPAYWELDTPAATWVSGAGPWVAVVELHGPGGLGDTLQRTLYGRCVEQDRQ